MTIFEARSSALTASKIAIFVWSMHRVGYTSTFSTDTKVQNDKSTFRLGFVLLLLLEGKNMRCEPPNAPV